MVLPVRAWSPSHESRLTALSYVPMTLDTDAKRGKFMGYFRVVQAGSNHGRAKPQFRAVKPHQLGAGDLHGRGTASLGSAGLASWGKSSSAKAEEKKKMLLANRDVLP